MLRTSNPVFSDRVYCAPAEAVATGGAMTVNGTVEKAFVLLMLVLAAALVTWHLAMAQAAITMPLVIGGLFGGAGMSFMYSSSPLGIGISVVVVIIAALNLVLDFDLIERGSAAGFPKYMEWYGAFALMVTLIWLYLEILRLLAKLKRR